MCGAIEMDMLRPSDYQAILKLIGDRKADLASSWGPTPNGDGWHGGKDGRAAEEEFNELTGIANRLYRFQNGETQ